MFPLYDYIKTRKFPFVNILLIIITVFVFFEEITASNPDEFIKAYALTPSSVNFNNFSTLIPFITAIFIHGGFLHIISNLWFLWIFGDNVEDYFGMFMFPVLYFLSGIVGNALQFFLMPHSDIPMLGASGAIAGVLGAYYQLYPYSKVRTLLLVLFIPLIIDVPAVLMLGYWFVLQIISGAASIPFTGQGGVAFFAHVGGFITGVIFAKLFMKKENFTEVF